MSALLQDYLPLVVFIGVALGLGLALLVAPFLVAYKNPDPEKLLGLRVRLQRLRRRAHEVRRAVLPGRRSCSSSSTSRSRSCFPGRSVFGDLGAYGFWSMMVFLGVLTIGFAYEWKKGALEWD